MVKVLCYKSKGLWFDPSWCHWKFSSTKNPSDRTMALGSTQPPTELSTRSISWGKGDRCVSLTTLPPSCPLVTKSGSLNFLEPSGPVQACNGTDLPLLVARLLRRSWSQVSALEPAKPTGFLWYLLGISRGLNTDVSEGLRKSWIQVLNLTIVQQDATYSVYYISVGSSTCFGCWHPSSAAGTAVIAASGID